MNSLVGPKRARLLEQVHSQDLVVAEAAMHGVDDVIRNAIDLRRQILSSFERELMAQMGQEHVDIYEHYAPVPEIKEFIDLWCGLVKSIPFDEQNFLDADYCDRIIDCFIPHSWNWDKDLVIVVKPKSELIINTLIDRGQKNIAVYLENHSELNEEQFSQSRGNIIIATDELQLADRISRINTRVRHVTTLNCAPGEKDSDDILFHVDSALRLGRKLAQIGVNTSARFSASWGTNILTNMPQMLRTKKLSDMKYKVPEHAVVIAPGPSLKKNISLLRKVQDRFFIVSPLRALGILEEYGITPDLVVQIDALSDEEAAIFEKNPPKISKSLLLEASVNPVFFDIKAENIIWTLIQKITDVHDVFKSVPTPFCAPSVAMYAAALCFNMGFKSICLLGQDLASDGDSIYTKGADKYLHPTGHISSFDIKVPGFWGNEVYTRNDFEFYIEQYGILAGQWQTLRPSISLINSTEGGAFIEGFEHLAFDKHIENVEVEPLLGEKAITFTDSKINSADKLHRFLFTSERALRSIIQICDQVIRLEGATEITATSQKKKRKLISKFSKLQKQISLLELTMQRELSETVGNSKTTSSVPTYEIFFSKVKKSAHDLLKVTGAAQIELQNTNSRKQK